MTGVAMTITPLAYNPDVNDSIITPASGIGITFDHRILAGSGNITLSIATNAGAAGTTVENFGVGSSVTIQGRKAIIDPTSNLNFGETYHISYPSGCFTNTSGDVDYVGTAYTFGVKAADNQLWTWGNNATGVLGQNQGPGQLGGTSSPVQIPGITWSMFASSYYKTSFATKKDGTLWIWGGNSRGALGLNAPVNSHKSSPTQIPGTTWGTTLNTISGAYMGGLSIKTDGTLWGWGGDRFGQLGQNESNKWYSSPVQVGSGTDWSKLSLTCSDSSAAIKTDGTLWMMGYNGTGQLGQNNKTYYSSPVQIPGTNWSQHASSRYAAGAVKTDGTLWMWGYNQYQGGLGQNSQVNYSSPIQVPGTTWKQVSHTDGNTHAVKTDGTLWSWGYGGNGVLGQNDRTHRSSPVQVPGTNWKQVRTLGSTMLANKTDGTLWVCGNSTEGQLGLNSQIKYSSPVQIPGTGWDELGNTGGGAEYALVMKSV